MLRATPRRLTLLAGLLATCSSLALLLFLPHDSSVLAFARFTTYKAVLLGTPFRDEQWLLRPPRFPVDLTTDVAFIIKTGYATQHRIPAQLDALGLQGSWAGDGNILVLGDFSTRYTYNGKEVRIFDM